MLPLIAKCGSANRRYWKTDKCTPFDRGAPGLDCYEGMLKQPLRRWMSTERRPPPQRARQVIDSDVVVRAPKNICAQDWSVSVENDTLKGRTVSERLITNTPDAVGKCDSRQA